MHPTEKGRLIAMRPNTGERISKGMRRPGPLRKKLQPDLQLTSMEYRALFAVHVSLLCFQADASGQRLSRNHLPVLRSSRIIRESRAIQAWQRCRHCTGYGETSCTFRFSTAVAMLPPQQPPEHLNKRTVFDLPWGGRWAESILVPILCLAVCFNHSIILSTARIA